MTNIKFDRKKFEQEIPLTKEVEEKISLFGTPLERIDEKEIEIEVFPNRPDLLSFNGFMRSFKKFLSIETEDKKYILNKPLKNFKIIIDKSVTEIRPFTACAIVKNIEFNEEIIKEIIEMQEKLHMSLGRNRKKAAIGIYPLEKISLPIKFEAREPKKINFIPLESEKEMQGMQILQSHPTGREYAHLLEGKKKFPVFVDSKNKILSMPPIINSQETGRITEETKDVFIECSGFHFETLKNILNILVANLIDLGGSAYQMEMSGEYKETTPDFSDEEIIISEESVNKILGLKLKSKDFEKLLKKMNHKYEKCKVSVKPWRTDILHEVDIAEEIAIAYGYDNFEEEIPNISTIGEESKEERVKNKLAEILVGLGLLEISTYHLIKKDESKTLDLVELEDSKTEYKFLRNDLLTPSLRILSENKDHEYPQSLFELGTVFSLNEDSETGIKENENLLVISAPSNFTEIKMKLDFIFSKLGISYGLRELEKEELIEGRTAEILIDECSVGYIGEIHPLTLNKWNIRMPCAVFEISLNKIFDKFD